MFIPARLNAYFSWSTSTLMHVAVGGAIAHFGSSAVVWLSSSSSPPGQAITIAARFAGGSAAADQPHFTSVIRPEAKPPKAQEQGELAPQATAIEKMLAKADTPQPILDHGELVERVVTTEVTDVVIGRKSAAIDKPQIEEDDNPADTKHAPRRLADLSEIGRDTAADDIDSLPSIAGADEPPSPFPSNPSPGYPTAAIRERREGRVVVRMIVSPTGIVTSAKVFKSSGWPDIDAMALATAKTWKFTPARRNGVPVSHEFIKPWEFRIEN